MTYIEELNHELGLTIRLLETITEKDRETKRGKKLHNQFLRRIQKVQSLIKAYHLEI